jgi:hypothetical protein
MPEEDEIDFRLAMRRAFTGKLFARPLHESTGGGIAIGRLKKPKSPGEFLSGAALPLCSG